MFEAIKEWFFSLGTEYGVNPITFGLIYVGAIPFFTASMAWLYRNLRRRRSIVAPMLSASFFFVSAYLYLAIVGRNIPVWVYVFISGVVLVGIYSAIKKIKAKVHETKGDA